MDAFTLYGDDLSSEQAQQWLDDEIRAYFRLSGGTGRAYCYHALNRLHGFRAVRGATFERCLGLGCAEGDELRPIAQQIKEIVVVEPAREWWRDRIAGTPSRYIAPNADGSIDLSSACVDLVVCLGALHHIANVSRTIEEIGRVAAPGAIALFREPHHDMGDPTKSRAGLTRNERGIPHAWFCSKAEQAGFQILSAHPCIFAGTPRLARLCGVRAPFNSMAMTLIDAALSRLTRWNRPYQRNTLLKKIGPSTTYYVLRRVSM